MKKILAILLAVVMTFSMLVPATASFNPSDAKESAAITASVDESASKYDDCFKTLYEIVHAIVHFVSAILDFDCPFCGGDKDDSDNDDTFTYEAVDVTAAQLKEILLANLTKNGDGNVIGATVDLTENYRLTDDWTSMVYATGNAYIPRITTLTVNGNGHVIAGLTAPLFAGNVAMNISISDLTIADSNIANGDEGGLGRGAIVAYADANVASLSMTNCNVINTEITATENGAAFVGYVSAGTISFTNCTANGVKINAGNNAAGIAGHLMTGSTEAKIENCKVKNCTFTSTKNRIGQIVGTVNGTGVLNVVNCEFAGDVCDPNRAYATINVTNA